MTPRRATTGAKRTTTAQRSTALAAIDAGKTAVEAAALSGTCSSTVSRWVRERRPDPLALAEDEQAAPTSPEPANKTPGGTPRPRSRALL